MEEIVSFQAIRQAARFTIFPADGLTLDDNSCAWDSRTSASSTKNVFGWNSYICSGAAAASCKRAAADSYICSGAAAASCKTTAAVISCSIPLFVLPVGLLLMLFCCFPLVQLISLRWISSFTTIPKKESQQQDHNCSNYHIITFLELSTDEC